MESRELHKLETFKESCLNIKLPKFKGCDSAMDIFTLQSMLEKLHEKRTPRTMLPGLLINNYLEDTALSLVKSVKDISEIWDRLNLAYGDPRSMLNKKTLRNQQIYSAADNQRTRKAYGRFKQDKKSNERPHDINRPTQYREPVILQ